MLIEKKTQLPQHNGAVMDLKFIFVCEEFESGSCHLESSSGFGKHFFMLYREKMLADLLKKHPAVEFGGGVGSANEFSDKLKYK